MVLLTPILNWIAGSVLSHGWFSASGIGLSSLVMLSPTVVIRFIIVLCLMGFLYEKLYKATVKLREGKTLIDKKRIQADKVEFPSITFCPILERHGGGYYKVYDYEAPFGEYFDSVNLLTQL